MGRTSFSVLALLASGVLVACGPSAPHGDDTTEPDAASECQQGQVRCQGSTYQHCEAGQWEKTEDCEAACVASVGCVTCEPGINSCDGDNVVACDANGEPGGTIQTCDGALTCVNGACVNACEEAAKNKSYIGCEYWAVDLDNAVEVLGVIGMEQSDGTQLTAQECTDNNGVSQNIPVCYHLDGTTVDGTAGLCDPPSGTCPGGYTCGAQNACVLNAQGSPFAIVVSNPQTKAANVTITGAGGATITQTIAAGAVTPIFPQQNGAIPDLSIDGTTLASKAYKIESDLPIVAYQFNPLNNVKVFSNDASLLVPRAAWDTDYYAMSYPTLNRRNVGLFQTPQHPYYGFVTVVAWEDGTEISVTPKAAVQASATQQTIAAGATKTFTLNAFDVLQLEAAPTATGDLTGTHIVSTNGKTVGVFGGHEATLFGETTAPDQDHTNGPCCADHLEEMLFPSTTWGKTFAIARSKQRSNEPDLVRILAQKPNTTITFNPAPSSGTCGTLGPGQFCEVKLMSDTEISSTEPVLVGHYLLSAMWRDNPFFPFIQPTWVGTGDPSMSIAVPTEQFRKSYTILVPSQYAKNYVSIAAAATGGVSVDGTPVNVMMPFPSGGSHRGAVIELSAGQHKITCADGCGITVYGYSDAVSYMFAGGLDLKPLVIL
jgi:hypothetical protein